MKASMNTFGFSPFSIKLHLHTDRVKFKEVLNENVDTLVGLNEEVFTEGFDYHEKEYKGIIRDGFFEITSKHVIGVLRTYNPWTIRGDFQNVGSNVELTLSLKKTKSLREVLFLFVVFPLIALFIVMSTDGMRASDFIVLCVGVVAPLAYHLSSRWVRFITLRHFSKLLSKKIILSQTPS